MESIEGGTTDGVAADARDEAREDARDEAALSEERRERAVWTNARLLYLAGGAALIGFVFWWLQFSTGSICCGDFDGYYHTKWSRMMWDGLRAGKFPPLFTQLPLTTLSAQDYVDHHFLFHVLQIPFTWFGDPVLGIKTGTLIFATLAVLSCYWLVLRYRLRYPAVWLVALLACSTPFLYRMSMAKAMSVSIVMLVAGIYLLFERRHVWLLPLAFLFSLAYDMWALLCVAAVVWSGIVFWQEGRVEWRPVVYTAAGSLLGFVINPYFPHNVELFAQHLLMKVTRKDFPTAVGGEWYPYDTWEFLFNCLVACVSMVAGYIAFQPGGDKKLTARSLFFLIFSTLLLVANMRWKRFAEYWPPFAVLFAAFTLQTVFERASAGLAERLPEDVLDELRPYLDRHESPAAAERETRARWIEYALVGVALVLLGAVGVGNVVIETREIADTAPPKHYRGGVEWIRKNVPPGEMIFNTDWDDFPRLFYFAPEYRYVSGLDPTYLHDRNPELSELYGRITTGKEDDPGPLIRERFGARYVFTDNQHEDFVVKALDSGWFDEPVYEDEDCTVLRIRDAKAAPPPDEEDNPAPPQNEGDAGDDEAEPEEEEPEP